MAGRNVPTVLRNYQEPKHMSINAQAENSTEQSDRPGSYSIPRLGVDARGRTHYYHDEKSRVIVYDEAGEEVHVEDLNGRTLDAWIEFISASIGWEQKPGNWVDMLVDALASEVN